MSALDEFAALGLISLNLLEFERALLSIEKHKRNKDGLQEALALIVESRLLGPTEAGRRMRVLLDIYEVPPEELCAMATRLPDSAVLRNAIGAVLPPTMKSLLYRSRGEVRDTKISNALSAKAPSRTEPPERSVRSREEPRERFRVVLLLGDESDHSSNMSLLEQRGFARARIAEPEALAQVDLDDVCAVIVARSWWQHFTTDKLEGAVSAICELSSLILIRIDTRGLPLDVMSRMGYLCQQACIADRAPNSLLWIEESQLMGMDVDQIEKRSEVLCASEEFGIAPAGLTSRQSKVMRYAVIKHLGERQRLDYLAVDQVTVGIPPMARSGNQTLIVYPPEGRAPFVVRLGNFPFLKLEYEKIRNLITPFDSWIKPTISFEGDVAALVYDVVNDPDNHGVAAPTLSTRFRAWDAEQLPHPLNVGPQPTNLIMCLRRAFSKLETMNGRDASTEPGYGYSWIVANIRSLQSHGVSYSVLDASGCRIQISSIAERAYAVIKNSERIALVHGDANLDNILARDDREAVLIDFQLCGAGHPLYDVWHFGVAVLNGLLRPVVGEDELASAISLVLLGGASIEVLRDAHPELMQSACNGMCFEALQCLRETSQRLIASHELPPGHFEAMGVVVACYALTLRHPQVLIARALIQALLPGLPRPSQVDVESTLMA